MYEIAEQVAHWLAAGEQVLVAQVVATKGFSSREPGAALAWTDRDLGRRPAARSSTATSWSSDRRRTGRPHGSRRRRGRRRPVLRWRRDRARARTPRTCPPDTWSRLQRHEPVCLVSELADDVPPRHRAVHPGRRPRRARATGSRRTGVDVGRLFARGDERGRPERGPLARPSSRSGRPPNCSWSARAPSRRRWPTTPRCSAGRVTVTEDLGHGHRARGDGSPRATRSSCSATTARPTCRRWRRCSAGSAGYVGALGSRRTQAARRDGLEQRGVAAEPLARIHGPAGLDIDAHTPAEIAVSIVAEIVMTQGARSGVTGGSISRREWPGAHRRCARPAAAALTRRPRSVGDGDEHPRTGRSDLPVVGRGGLPLVRAEGRLERVRVG